MSQPSTIEIIPNAHYSRLQDRFNPTTKELVVTVSAQPAVKLIVSPVHQTT